MLYMGKNGQHVPQRVCSPRVANPGLLKTAFHALSSIPGYLTEVFLAWDMPSSDIPLPPCPELTPGVPHAPKFAQWINMDRRCDCGPILTSEAHLITLLARYFSLRHT